MRIIAGTWRRRIIAAPPGTTTRPMPDRVRHSVFETIGSRLGTLGGLPPVCVLDLFAGSGSVGLEALSRGATWCGFVENDRLALTTLRRNISEVLVDQAAEMTRVVDANAFEPATWTRRLHQAPCEIVFIDPPYRDTRTPTPDSRIIHLLHSLAGSTLLADNVCVVLRHEAKASYDQTSFGRLQAFDVRRYGDMTVTYLANGSP